MNYSFLHIYKQLKDGNTLNLKSKFYTEVGDFSIKPFLQDINISEINENNFRLVFDEIIKQNNGEFIIDSGYSFNLLALCCAYRPDFPEYIFEYLGNSMNLKNDSKHTSYLLQVAIDNKINVNISKGSFVNSFFLYEKYKLTPLIKSKNKIFDSFFCGSIDITNPETTSVFLKLIRFNFAKDNHLFNPYSHSLKTIQVFSHYMKDYILTEYKSAFSNPNLNAIKYSEFMFDFLKNEIDYNVLFDYHYNLLDEYTNRVSIAPMDIILSYFLSINDNKFQKNKVLPMANLIYSICEKRFSGSDNPSQRLYPQSYLTKMRVEEKIKILDNIEDIPEVQEVSTTFKKRI